MVIHNRCLPLYLALQGCWLRSLTRITYISKLIGISSLAAYQQHQLLWVKLWLYLSPAVLWR
ncbi:hypothetical protein DVQ84_02055 [Yersinia enterocolitica]|nr:hypothetical protein [Yersinia enterocolitica]QBP97816.1 hypothetical protein YEY1_02680 [Yersinia enterocolitica subsp. palearctica]EKN5957226.1 hypothetical protein [Yersinia enterocolitica]EKN5967151.1 hypothetical protein [Yersinia enterocolitica]EKN5971629.1 hypothetical protein [Yersinia enterocolitica]